MSFLFDSFQSWKEECATQDCEIFDPVLAYEVRQRNRSTDEIWMDCNRPTM